MHPRSAPAATGGRGPSGRRARRPTRRARGRRKPGSRHRYREPVPELPQMQALSERLQERVGGAALAGVQPIGFSGLKTFDPLPESLVGRTLERTGRRGKYLILDFGGPPLLLAPSPPGPPRPGGPPEA